MLTVIMRGIGHRPGRTAILLLLAIVATAAAVLTPGYTRAAQESLLYDELRAHEGQATMASFQALVPGAGGAVQPPGGEAIAGNEDFAQYIDYLPPIIAQNTNMEAFGDPTGFIRADVDVQADSDSTSALGYRENSCEHITMVEGDCLTTGSQVLMSQRSAESQGIDVGDEIELRNNEVYAAQEAGYEIAGIYRPDRPDDDYWGRSNFFGHTDLVAPDELSVLDTLLVTDPEGFGPVGERVRVGVEYPLDIDKVNLSNVDERIAGLKPLEDPQTSPHPTDSGSQVRWQADVTLPDMMTEVRGEQDAIADAVPVVAIPLVLMCWFVLFLMVAHIVAERGPELAVAKLRGHRQRRLRIFVLGEICAVILLATPLGVLAGLAAVRVVTWQALAAGTTVEFTAEVGWYAAAAVVGAVLAALLASRRAIRRPVVDLMRRVPARGTRRTFVIEAVLATLTAVALYQVLSSDDFSEFGLLVTPLLAVLAGVVLARVMTFIARRRVASAACRGAVGHIVTWARLARRGEWHRVVVLVTVAVALLTFGVATWDIAERNRQLSATDEYGAPTVYQLSKLDPRELQEVVEEVDPSGSKLAGVVRSFQRYGDENFNEVAVQSQRFAQVADWRGHDAADLTDSAAALRPKQPTAVTVTGDLTIDATVHQVDSEEPVKLAARVIRDGEEIETLRMEDAELKEAEDSYEITLPNCDDDCRLLGIGVGRYPGDFSGIEFEMDIDGIADDSGSVDASLGDEGSWRPAADTAGEVDLDVTTAADSTRMAVSDTRSYEDIFMEYAAIPHRLPVAVAGGVPGDDPGAGKFEFLAPHGELQPYTVAEETSVVPRGGPRGLLVDLEYTTLAAEPFGSIASRDNVSFEIWSDEPPDENTIAQLNANGVSVEDVMQRDDHLTRLERAAPALAFQLNLLAAVAALLLSVGTVMLTTAAGSVSRGLDNAGLRVAGVSRAVLRRAMLREFLWVVTAPLAAGVGCGLAGAWLILPGVSLVSTDPPPVGPEYWLGPWWVPATVAVATLCLTLTAIVMARWQQKRGNPNRLYQGEQ